MLQFLEGLGRGRREGAGSMYCVDNFLGGVEGMELEDLCGSLG